MKLEFNIIAVNTQNLNPLLTVLCPSSHAQETKQIPIKRLTTWSNKDSPSSMIVDSRLDGIAAFFKRNARTQRNGVFFLSVNKCKRCLYSEERLLRNDDH